LAGPCFGPEPYRNLALYKQRKYHTLRCWDKEDPSVRKWCPANCLKCRVLCSWSDTRPTSVYFELKQRRHCGKQTQSPSHQWLENLKQNVWRIQRRHPRDPPIMWRYGKPLYPAP